MLENLLFLTHSPSCQYLRRTSLSAQLSLMRPGLTSPTSALNGFASCTSQKARFVHYISQDFGSDVLQRDATALDITQVYCSQLDLDSLFDFLGQSFFHLRCLFGLKIVNIFTAFLRLQNKSFRKTQSTDSVLFQMQILTYFCSYVTNRNIIGKIPCYMQDKIFFKGGCILASFFFFFSMSSQGTF